jgi:hypothetical protein
MKPSPTLKVPRRKIERREERAGAMRRYAKCLIAMLLRDAGSAILNEDDIVTNRAKGKFPAKLFLVLDQQE